MVSPKQPFGLMVDASGKNVAGCLFQWSADGQEKPIAFVSSKLSTTQCNWSTVEWEAYAVIFCLRKFNHYLFAASMTIFCDHNPLVYTKDCAPSSAKLTHWALALQLFYITFKFKPGRNNFVANYLMRATLEGGDCQ